MIWSCLINKDRVIYALAIRAAHNDSRNPRIRYIISNLRTQKCALKDSMSNSSNHQLSYSEDL